MIIIINKFYKKYDCFYSKYHEGFYFFIYTSNIFFITEVELNRSFIFFIMYAFVIIYSIAYISTILLIILKIINIKFKSQKIKRINKILFKFFCVFVMLYIISLGTIFIGKHLYKINEVKRIERIEKLENSDEHTEKNIDWDENNF